MMTTLEFKCASLAVKLVLNRLNNNNNKREHSSGIHLAPLGQPLRLPNLNIKLARIMLEVAAAPLSFSFFRALAGPPGR